MELNNRELDRFWSSVLKTDSCWIWIGRRCHSKPGQNYGQFYYRGKNLLAHRISYFLQYGINPGKYLVRHTCDHPWCVNPFHLVLGTHKDNSQDMVQRNRSTKGESNPRAKLTKEQVQTILDRYTPYDKSNGMRPLSREFGVSVGTIGFIVSGKTWNED